MKRLLRSSFVLSATLALLAPALVFAQVSSIKAGLEDTAQRAGYSTNFCNRAVGSACIAVVVGNIINVLLSLSGLVLLGLLVYAGFKWMTASDSKDVTAATETIRNAIVGLLIVVASYAIADFVVGRLSTIVGAGQGVAQGGDDGGAAGGVAGGDRTGGGTPATCAPGASAPSCSDSSPAMCVSGRPSCSGSSATCSGGTGTPVCFAAPPPVGGGTPATCNVGVIQCSGGGAATCSNGTTPTCVSGTPSCGSGAQVPTCPAPTGGGGRSSVVCAPSRPASCAQSWQVLACRTDSPVAYTPGGVSCVSTGPTTPGTPQCSPITSTAVCVQPAAVCSCDVMPPGQTTTRVETVGAGVCTECLTNCRSRAGFTGSYTCAQTYRE